jgi:hypothetical protein
MAMVHEKRVFSKDIRERSLRGSRFAAEPIDEAMMQSLPADLNDNARFSSIDVNFKRQIDELKQNKLNNSSLPATMMTEDTTHNGNLQHNDSIYQSSVNQSMQSGYALTPKRL